MSKYITATEAARRLGVTDKTVRLWIKQGNLDAHHVAKNKLAILAADVEALRRKRENYQDETPDISLLVARIVELECKCADLDQKYSDLERKYLELSSVVGEKGKKQAASQLVMSDTAVSQKGSTVENKAVPVGVPDGSMLFADFAEKHGVPRATFSHHVKVGIKGDIVATIKRPKPGRPAHAEYWLSPDQQTAALAYWDSHSVKYRR